MTKEWQNEKEKRGQKEKDDKGKDREKTREENDRYTSESLADTPVISRGMNVHEKEETIRKAILHSLDVKNVCNVPVPRFWTSVEMILFSKLDFV